MQHCGLSSYEHVYHCLPNCYVLYKYGRVFLPLLITLSNPLFSSHTFELFVCSLTPCSHRYCAVSPSTSPAKGLRRYTCSNDIIFALYIGPPWVSSTQHVTSEANRGAPSPDIDAEFQQLRPTTSRSRTCTTQTCFDPPHVLQHEHNHTNLSFFTH